jgi:transposase
MRLTNRVSRDQRLKQVRAWVGSGVSCEAFARRARIKPGTLAWWKWKLQAEGVRLTAKRPRKRKPPPKQLVPFVEITPAPTLEAAPPRIELALGDVTLRVPDGFDPGTLGRVLELVRSAR